MATSNWFMNSDNCRLLIYFYFLYFLFRSELEKGKCEQKDSKIARPSTPAQQDSKVSDFFVHGVQWSDFSNPFKSHPNFIFLTSLKNTFLEKNFLRRHTDTSALIQWEKSENPSIDWMIVRLEKNALCIPVIFPFSPLYWFNSFWMSSEMGFIKSYIFFYGIQLFQLQLK